MWEWSAGETFDALDQPSLTTAHLSSVAPEEWSELIFHFHPSVHRVNLDWNIPQLWRAIKHHAEIPSLQQTDSSVAWILWREKLDIHFRSLTDVEAWTLDQARGGAAFGELCEGLCEWMEPGSVVEFMTNQLAQWLQSQWITAISKS